LQNQFPAAKLQKSAIERRDVGGRTIQKMIIMASGFEQKEPVVSGGVEMFDFPQLKSNVEQWATEAGVTVRNINGGGRSFPGPNIIRTPFSLRLSGNLEQELRFLNEIASLRLNVKFSKIMFLSRNNKVPSDKKYDLIIDAELVRPS